MTADAAAQPAGAPTTPPDDRPRRDRPWRRRLVFASRFVFLAAALGLLGYQLAGDASGALAAVRRIGMVAVFGAFATAMLGMGASGLAWRSLLRGVGAPMPVPAAARIFFIGQIGKYLPGTVWAYVAQAKLGREYGVPASRTTAASVLFVAAHTATGAVVGLLVVPFTSSSLWSRFWWLAVLAPALLVLLHPRLIRPILVCLHRVLRRGTPPATVSGAAILRSLGWLALTWGGYGTSTLLLVSPLAQSNNDASLVAISFGGFALAWTVGFVAAGVLVVAPAGIGVREVTLSLLLSPYLFGGGAVAAVVVLSRVLHTVADGVWAIGATALKAPAESSAAGDYADDAAHSDDQQAFLR